jgi:hypothetical protein
MAHVDAMVQRPKLETEDRGRGRGRGRIGEAVDTSPVEDADGPENHSSGSEGPSRKRRRSRKGLDKKFECPQEGCGKSYSRAEHL